MLTAKHSRPLEPVRQTDGPWQSVAATRQPRFPADEAKLDTADRVVSYTELVFLSSCLKKKRASLALGNSAATVRVKTTTTALLHCCDDDHQRLPLSRSDREQRVNEERAKEGEKALPIKTLAR